MFDGQRLNDVFCENLVFWYHDEHDVIIETTRPSYVDDYVVQNLYYSLVDVFCEKLMFYL